MFKRNSTAILVILAMFLIVFNYDFANISFQSNDFWLSLVAGIILIASAVSIFINEFKNN